MPSWSVSANDAGSTSHETASVPVDIAVSIKFYLCKYLYTLRFFLMDWSNYMPYVVVLPEVC